MRFNLATLVLAIIAAMAAGPALIPSFAMNAPLGRTLYVVCLCVAIPLAAVAIVVDGRAQKRDAAALNTKLDEVLSRLPESDQFIGLRNDIRALKRPEGRYKWWHVA